MEYKPKEEIAKSGFLDLHEYIIEGMMHLVTKDLRIIANMINELLEDE